MNIKTTLSALTLGLALLPMSASATLLIGFSDFDTTAANDTTPDGGIGGFSGIVDKNTESQALGGSNDGFYGAGSIPAATNDGLLRLTPGSLLFSVTNSTGSTYSLDTLLFDAVKSTEASRISVSYKIDGGSSTVVATSLNPVYAAPTLNLSADYSDYLFSLGILLVSGSTIEFSFDLVAGAGARLDNLALTGLSAIPETASAMALALLIGGGLMTRNRRSAAAPTLA